MVQRPAAAGPRHRLGRLQPLCQQGVLLKPDSRQQVACFQGYETLQIRLRTSLMAERTQCSWSQNHWSCTCRLHTPVVKPATCQDSGDWS